MSGTLQASTIRDSASATNNLALDSSGNVTVGNNLTVSGTGNTSFGGNVGIGTSSPSLKLTVEGNGSQIRVRNTTTRYRTDYAVDSAGTSSLVTYDDTGGVYKQMNIYASPLTFNTTSAGAETARIDSSGNLIVGGTTANGRVTSNIGSASTAGYAVYYSASGGSGIGYRADYTGTSGTGYSMYFTYNGTGCGSVTVTSGATAFNTSSDYRLKENVQPMQNALATIGALKPVTYNWTSNKAQGEGFIAHELQAVIPLAVVGEKDEVDDEGNIKAQGVDYSKIVVHLVAALQEAVAKITALEDRITKLESVK